jgi:hypothetical protein
VQTAGHTLVPVVYAGDFNTPANDPRSLASAFVVSFAGDSRVNGRKVEASGQTVGILQFGASIALSDAVLLIATVGAGLTHATPDFLFGLALAIRF